MLAELHAIIRRCAGGDDVFAKIVLEIRDRPSPTLHACRHEKKRKGELWELLCREYLRHNGYESVHRFEDVSDASKTRLGLGPRDMGIDLIGTKNGVPVAVQCKFRSRKSVTWREVATFEALCARTGPWCEHIVMTNCSFVKREGTSEKDVSFTHHAFKAAPRHVWLLIGGMGAGRTLGEVPRDRWLARLESKSRPAFSAASSRSA